MTCRQLKSVIVDIARDCLGDPIREPEVREHLIACHRCAALVEAERAMSVSLRPLAEETQGLPPGPRTEDAILAAFDAAWLQPRRRIRTPAWLPAAAAVLLALGATLLWMTAGRTPPPRATADRPAMHDTQLAESIVPPAAPSADAERAADPDRTSHRNRNRSSGRSAVVPSRPPEFVPWPGAAALPTFESGQLVRLDLPASLLPSLGLLPSPLHVGVVQADVLIGQDGFARAVRLVP